MRYLQRQHVLSKAPICLQTSTNTPRLETVIFISRRVSALLLYFKNMYSPSMINLAFAFQTCALALEKLETFEDVTPKPSPASGITLESYTSQRETEKALFERDETRRLTEESDSGSDSEQQEWNSTFTEVWWTVEPQLAGDHTTVIKWSGTMSQQVSRSMDESIMACFAHFTNSSTKDEAVFVDLQCMFFSILTIYCVTYHSCFEIDSFARKE